MKSIAAAALLATAGSISIHSPAAADDCSDVTIAELNWPSAGVFAWIDKLILEAGYGCEVALVEGDTNSEVASLVENGSPAIIPEFWFDGMTEALDEAVADSKVVFGAAILSDGGVQGLWMPKFIADANPAITTVQEALKHPELFMPAEADGKAALFNCPEGWVCKIATENLFRALGGEQAGFTIVDAASPSDLDESIVRAFDEGKGWLGYYWAPNALLSEHPMVKLSLGVEFSKSEWDDCTIVEGCPDPKVNAYPQSAVYTLVEGEFAADHPALMDYLNTRSLSSRTLSDVLAWQEAEGADNEAAARHFFAAFPDIWQAWLPEGLAATVAERL